MAVPPSISDGPHVCEICGKLVIWCIAAADLGPVPVDQAAALGGELEIYTEHFPSGDPVDPGVHYARRRPATRPASSPAWFSHLDTCRGGRR